MLMKIVLVSDTHLSPHEDSLTQNWRVVKRWLCSTMPDIVLHLGDITANGVHDASELSFARAEFRDLPVEIRFIPGNHDIGDHPPEPGKVPHDPLDLNRLREYRDSFGWDWWMLERGSWLFVGLNALLMGTGTLLETAQFSWLAEIVASHAGPLGIFLHKPLFQHDPDENIVHERYVPRAARLALLDILRFADLRFVAAGHTHQSRQVQCGAVEHVWVPSCAFMIPDILQERIGEKLVGVVLLEIDSAGHRFTPIVPAGLKANDLLDYRQLYPGIDARLQALSGKR